MEHLIFASYGNDSIALIQWAHERGFARRACGLRGHRMGC